LAGLDSGSPPAFAGVARNDDIILLSRVLEEVLLYLIFWILILLYDLCVLCGETIKDPNLLGESWGL
jgi:hypothetical protein